jgi:hypothetical protein
MSSSACWPITVQRSPAAVQKHTTGLTPDGLPVHSFQSLLVDLATVARNTVTASITPNYPLCGVTRLNHHPAQGVPTLQRQL